MSLDVTPDASWASVLQLTPSGADASVSDVAPESAAETSGDANTASSETVSDELAPLISFRGLGPTQNEYVLDGVSAEQQFRGSARGAAGDGVSMGTAFATSAMSSQRVSAGGFDAAYSGAGGLTRVESVRGTSEFHGSASYTLRDSAFAATNPYSLVQQYANGSVTSAYVKPQDLLQESGGSVAGPLFGTWLASLLKRHIDNAMLRHVTGTANFEQQWRGFSAISSPSDPAFFSLTLTQMVLLGNRGVTAAATTSALTYLQSLMGEVPRSARRTLAFARVDAPVSTRDDLAVSYTRSHFSSPSGAGSGASAAVVARGRSSVADSTIRIDALTLRWIHSFSADFTNELRAQFARDDEFEQALAPLAQEPAISPGGFAPQVSIASGSFIYGTPANALGRQAYPDETRVQLVDVAQRVAGHHLLTLGFDWSRIHERISDLQDLTGTFTYDNPLTNGHAGGLVDWITDYTFGVNAYPNGGCPKVDPMPPAPHYFCFHSFTQGFGQQQTEFVLHEFAGFAQDSWHLREGLSMQLGARYEYLLLPLPQQPNIALDAVFAARGATSVFPEDRNNLAPRIAIAWAPHAGQWFTARVGYGIFYGREPGATVRAALANTALPSSTTHIRITPKTETPCPQMPSVGFGFPCAYEAAPPAAVAATTSAMLYAKNFRLPAVQEFQLTLERELRHGLTVKAGYSDSLAVQLPKTVDLNIAPATQLAKFVLQGGDGRTGAQDRDTFAVPMYTARLVPQWGPVTALTSSANATWHAGTIEARWETDSTLQLRASYTWSKAIDYGAAQGAIPPTNGQFDPYEIGYDKGLADFNIPHRFTAAVSCQSTSHVLTRWIEQTLTGWRFAAIMSASSGRPYSYEVSGGNYLTGGHESLNGAGGSTWLPTAGRNTLRLPARWNIDTRVSRDFKLKGATHLSGFVEAFNLTNRNNVAKVQTRAFLVGTTVNGVTPLVFQNATTIATEGLNELPFGAPSSSTTAFSAERKLQLGVKLQF